ncbi:hypothetical protein [Sphingobium sp.]|uniref:hypothetical protein n=1 Tax=Sphingobium sp. TaxID=1912891 RepID=UPI0028BDF8D7|nr:hypothetical protein [Sphingobium sp.]
MAHIVSFRFGHENALEQMLLQLCRIAPISPLLPYIVKHVGVAGGNACGGRKLHICVLENPWRTSPN